MKRFSVLLGLILALGLALAACTSPAPTENPSPMIEVEKEEPVQITNTPTTMPPSETPTPKPTKGAPATGPLATAAALAKQVTVQPATPMGGIKIEGPDDYVGLIKQAWSIVEANYVRDNFNGADWDAIYDEYVALAEDVESQEEVWDLLADLIHELNDDHSRFVPPQNMEAEFDVETSDSAEPRPFSGIILWPGPSREDEYLFVWDVCAISPAASSGIRRGDIITAIDGEPVIRGEDGYSAEYASLVGFGSGAETIELTIQQGPDHKTKDITLTFSGVGDCPGWEYGLVNTSPRIGYIRVPNFDGDAEHNIYQAIQNMETDAPLDGLIVDVRHNPGGNSDDSVAIFTEGIVGTVGSLREDSTRTTYRIRGPVQWNETTPVVVLTDGSSHSAADYFPAAMKELGRATIIGMNSAGNTEGITGFNLGDGTMIRLAVSTMALNDGTLLEDVGVTPDIEVPLGKWGLRQEPYDIQLQAGIDFLLSLVGG
ncbi:MAG: hypothetical protein DRI56_09965 [Chloroflexota bacterium]|nr:MAG: hypothetical protein DRI56_09965 [Chloroflexota bacterium]